MRILVVDVNCKGSSTGAIAYSLYSYLRAQGHEAAVCYGRGEEISGEDGIYKFGLDWETNIHAGLTRLTGYTGCYSPLSTRRLIRFMDVFKPDVVHIHEMHAYFVNIAAVVNHLRERKIKTVWTFHCEFMYTGKCGHAYECDRWKTGCGQCPSLKGYVSTLMFDRTAQMWEEKRRLFEGWDDLVITTPSQWLADRANESFLCGKRIEVVRNGIDTSVFRPKDAGYLKQTLRIPESIKVVLALAPNLMSDGKGGRWVLELAQTISDVAFVMIGINEPCEEYPENVIAKGPIYDKDLLADYYSMADAFVICSRRENYPTTCLEALACGTPVCGFDGGGTRETDPNHPERFVAYGDLEALRGRLLSVLGERGVPSMSSLASKEDMARDCLVLYERLLWS